MLYWQLWFFRADFPKKGISGVKQKSEDHYWILHIQISLNPKFDLERTILVFATTFAKRKVFPVKNRKNEHRYWILLIQISLSRKFQLEITILTFWSNFEKKTVLLPINKSEHHYWVLHCQISLIKKLQLETRI